MGADSQKFPEVQGSGSLILAWQIKGKNVLVIGGGEVAAGRILACLNADAVVTVVCPSAGLNAEVAHRVARQQVRHIDRKFTSTDLDPANNIAMVLVAVDDPAASTEIWQLCRARRIPANIADVPPECDFYFGSVHRDGPLQVMVSTNGKGPRLAAAIRRQIARSLPRDAGRAIEAVGVLRAKLRKAVPAVEDGPTRMGWMSRVCDFYSLDEMCELSEEDMDNLLRIYPSKEVPSSETLKGQRKDAELLGSLSIFDGSFGFSVGA